MQSTFVPVISTYPELTYFQCDDACSQMAGFRSMIVLMQSAGVGAVTLNYRCTAVVMLVSDDAAPIRHPGLVRTTSPCILVTSTILQQLSALRRSSVKKSALHQKVEVELSVYIYFGTLITKSNIDRCFYFPTSPI